MTFKPPGSSAPPPSGGSGFIRPRSFNPPNAREKDDVRLNERIRVPQVRLIDEKGEQVGIVATSDALKMARDRGLDLMEIAAGAKPPVCKILDYGKYKYEQKKKEHQARKNQIVVKVKEVQLRPNTDTHDLEYKIRNVKNFLEEGDKAKIIVMFRGREIAHTQPGYQMLRDIVEQLKEVAVVESPPKLEGKKLMMILAPNPLAKKASKPKTSATPA